MINKDEFSVFYLDKSILIKEIAKKYNITPRRVYVIAKQLNLKIRSEKKYKTPTPGDKFNKLTFIKETIGSGTRKYWQCKCECGKTKDFPYWGVFSLKTKTCGCYQRKIVSHNSWTGYGEISGKYWAESKQGAKNRSILFDLKIEEAWQIFLNQNRKCKLSGLEISFSRARNLFPQTASLDRIDNNKGYTLDNVQWLHKDVNRMKHCFTEEYFIALCKAIASNATEGIKNE